MFTYAIFGALNKLQRQTRLSNGKFAEARKKLFVIINNAVKKSSIKICQ